MVKTRTGAGIDVSRRQIIAMEPAPDPGADPVVQPVVDPPGAVPTTMEERRERARESMTLMETIINDYEESRHAGVPIGLDRVCEDLVITARAVRRSYNYLARYARDVDDNEKRHTQEMHDRAGKLAGLLGIAPQELIGLPVAELRAQVGEVIEEVIADRLPEAVGRIPQNRRQSLTSALGSRGNGGTTIIPPGMTYPFPRKVRTDWAAKLKVGMEYNAARTYLADVRDYVNLPQHVEYRDDMQFLRMVASSPMEHEALAQFREVADPSGEGAIVTDYASFIAWVELAFLDTVPAFVRQIQLEGCRQKAGENVDDYHTRFSGLVAGCDPRPSEENQAAIFLRNSLLPGMSKQRLLSDIAVGYYRSLADVYHVAKAVSTVPMTGMATRPYRSGYTGSGGRGTSQMRGRGGRMIARGGRAPGRNGDRSGNGGAVNVIDTSHLVCWHCGQQGHCRQDCPELRGVQAHTEEPEGSPVAGDIKLQDINVLRLSGGSQESF